MPYRAILFDTGGALDLVPQVIHDHMGDVVVPAGEVDAPEAAPAGLQAEVGPVDRPRLQGEHHRCGSAHPAGAQGAGVADRAGRRPDGRELEPTATPARRP